MTKEKIVTALQYKYPDEESYYSEKIVTSYIVAFNQPKSLDKLCSIIGGKLFAELAFEKQKLGWDALGRAASTDKVEHTKYFLSVPEIKNALKVTNDEEKNEVLAARVNSIIYYLFVDQSSENDQILEEQWEAYNFDIETISKGLIYHPRIWTYISVERLKKMVSMIGSKVFVQEVVSAAMLKVLYDNKNSFWLNTQEIYDYVLSIPGVSEKFGEEIKKFEEVKELQASDEEMSSSSDLLGTDLEENKQLKEATPDE